ncbi:MAG: hypothetical protein ACLUO8_09350 [Christensenellales bacterium]
MEQIWQIVLAIIASIGGAGIIILGVVKFTSDMIAERLSKRYEIKLNKKLEAFKAGINKKTYISRARFDTEFQIYRELSESVLSMIECTYWLFPSGLDHLPSDKEEEKKIYIERYNKARDAISLAQKSIRANAPFIPSDFYAKFEELSKLCLSLNAAFSLLIWYIWKRTYYGNPIRFIERSKWNTWHFVNELQNTIQTYQNDMEVTRNERGTGADPV